VSARFSSPPEQFAGEQPELEVDDPGWGRGETLGSE
jgi:hypothetical protein